MIAASLSSGSWFTVWPLIVGVQLLVIVALGRALIRERKRRTVC